jgi:dephospho-CoA kinase
MIISIFGQNKAGKTTLADMLVSGFGFVKVSFADALREIAELFFGINTDWKTEEPWTVTYGYLDRLSWLFSIIKDKNNIEQLMIDKIKHAKTKDQAYRITLELLGTEVFRKMVLNEIWCALAAFAVVRCAASGEGVVFDDMRFLNEYEVLGNFNTKFVRITSPFEEPVGEHESQKYVEGFKEDYIIINDGTKEELLEKFKKQVVLGK